MGPFRKGGGRVTLNQIAAELGISKSEANRIVLRFRHVYPATTSGNRRYYSAKLIDTYRAQNRLAHESLDQPDEDWLARYQTTSLAKYAQSLGENLG